MFITFEGPEGAGKSVQARRLTQRLEAAGWATLLTREPGGTSTGDALRSILLQRRDLPLTPRAQALVLCAARAQLVEDVIGPALASGTVVVCDRYADSTLAYQGYGYGLPLAELESVVRFATGGLQPDVTVLLDLPVQEGLRRKQAQSGDWDRFEVEAVAFHARVRSGYHALAATQPHRWLLISASDTPDAVAEQVWTAVHARLPRR